MLPQVDPKYTFWIGVWTNILILIAGYGVQHAPSYVAQYAPDVQWFAGLFAQINGLVLTALAGISSSKLGPFINLPAPSPQNVAKVLSLAFAVSLFLGSGSAHAAQRSSAMRSVTGEALPCDPANLLPGCKKTSASATAPAVTNDQPCDISILTKLTPQNLVPTLKKCGSNDVQVLADGTQAALDSAKAFKPNPDQDGINCLTPALALFKAGVQTPAVPAVPAVLNADGSIKTEAVPAIPAKDPNLVLLFQKYREFTLAGGLTSCQNYIKTPVNATIAAAGQVAADGVAIGAAAAAIAPIK